MQLHQHYGKITVRFLRPHAVYQTNDLAGFDEEAAAWLSARGIAERDGKPDPKRATPEPEAKPSATLDAKEAKEALKEPAATVETEIGLEPTPRRKRGRPRKNSL